MEGLSQGQLTSMRTPEPPITWLPDNFSGPFPSPIQALKEPDGLLAAGGNLKPETLLQAYRQGIFPWYSEGQPILWWSPDPRCVLYPDNFHISRSFRRTLNKDLFTIKTNTAFRDVMLACAEPRLDQDGTWILYEMIEAYCALNDIGKAISVECWFEDELVGGIYGLKLGDVFFGESMFSKMKDASKVAMHHICQTMKPALIDGQIHSDHLSSLGAEMISRQRFLSEIDQFSASKD